MNWDRAEREWVGSVVLVGLTHMNHDDTMNRQEQFYGQIESVDRDVGVRLELSGRRGGEIYDLPPQLDAFEPAPKGEYRLRSTGEIVRDPDFLCSWTIYPPKDA